MTSSNKVFSTIAPFLRGIGQIMLQDSALTGLFFLAGIFCGSCIMGVAALLSVITGTYTAKLLHYAEEQINGGLYGFSATLVGAALVFLFQPTAIIWCAIVLGSMLATVIQHFFIARRIPVYTFPFILVVWVFIFVFHHFLFLAQPQSVTDDTFVNNSLATFSLGFGQIIFQGSILAGILFFIGVLVNKPVAAIYALGGIVLSGTLAHQLGVPLKDIYMGLLSYNAVLCAIAFAGKKLEDFIMAFISVILSVLIIIEMRKMDLPALTFPFVLACWLVLTSKIAKQTAQLKLKQ